MRKILCVLASVLCLGLATSLSATTTRTVTANGTSGAGTLRQAEQDSIENGAAKDLYGDLKKDYSTLSPAEQMTAKSAARASDAFSYSAAA